MDSEADFPFSIDRQLLIVKIIKILLRIKYCKIFHHYSIILQLFGIETRFKSILSLGKSILFPGKIKNKPIIKIK